MERDKNMTFLWPIIMIITVKNSAHFFLIFLLNLTVQGLLLKDLLAVGYVLRAYVSGAITQMKDWLR